MSIRNEIIGWCFSINFIMGIIVIPMMLIFSYFTFIYPKKLEEVNSILLDVWLIGLLATEILSTMILLSSAIFLLFSDEDSKLRKYLVSRKYKKEQKLLNETYSQYPICVICQKNVRSIRLNCGHTCFCHTCVRKINKCSICLTKISLVEEGYFCQKSYANSSESEEVV